MKKKSTHNKKINYGLLVFLFFLIFSFLLVMLLEYLDFKMGKQSYFFNKKETIKQINRPIQENTSLNWSKIFSKNIELLDRFVDQNQIEHVNMRISDIKFDSFRNHLRTHVKEWGGQLSLIEVNKKKEFTLYLFHIFKNQFKTHILLVFSLLPTDEKPSNNETSTPQVVQNSNQKKVAIIIDDIGSRANIVEKLQILNIPITVSVLVDEPFAASEVISAQNKNFEAIIHLPMQPHNGQNGPKHHVISPESTIEQMREILNHSCHIVPNAKGINNHQGSLATSKKDTMRTLFTVLKEKGFYFIDSRTSVDSVAYTVAQEMGIKSSFRDLFIDHIPTIEHSREQFLRLFELLQKKNSVLLIGHPHETTIQTIKEVIPKLKQMRVKFVFASELVHK